MTQPGREEVRTAEGGADDQLIESAEGRRGQLTESAEGRRGQLTESAEGRRGQLTESAEGRRGQLTESAEGRRGQLTESAEWQHVYKDDSLPCADETTVVPAFPRRNIAASKGVSLAKQPCTELHPNLDILLPDVPGDNDRPSLLRSSRTGHISTWISDEHDSVAPVIRPSTGQSQDNEIELLTQQLRHLESSSVSLDMERFLGPTLHKGAMAGPGLGTSGFASQIARVSVEAMHKDQQLNTSKALIDAQAREIERQRAEQKMLLHKISKMEKELDQVSLPPWESLDHLSPLPSDGDLQRRELATSQDSPVIPEVNVKCVPVPSYLQKKLEKQKLTITKLMTANHHWDDYSRKLKADYEQKIGEQAKIVQALTSKIEESKANDVKRQKDTDRLLLSAKKKLDACETEKDMLNGRLNQMASEIAELKVAAVASKREADTALVQLSECKAQLSLAQQQVETQRQIAAAGARAAAVIPTPAPRQDVFATELAEQNALLQQQLNVYKDDFDNERADRERLQQKILDLQTQYDRLKAEFRLQQQQLQRNDEEVTRLRNEIERLRGQLTVQAAEVRSLRCAVVKPWQCGKCTFRNPNGRKFCEMCGFPGGGVSVDGVPRVPNLPPLDPSLFAAAAAAAAAAGSPPAPSAPTGDLSGFRSSSLSSEHVVIDSAHIMQQESANAVRRQ